MTILHDKAIEALCTPVDDLTRFKYQKITLLEKQGLVSTYKVDDEIMGNDKPMISPFVAELVRKDSTGAKLISYGLSSMGYDVRLSNDVKIFTNANSTVIDPMVHDDNNFVQAEIKKTDIGLDYFIIPPNSYALGHTLETFSVPRDVIILCLGKSTYARAGAIINTTPIEPGFEGQVVIEIANGTPSPMRVYTEGGIAQFVFMRGMEPCEVSYADRGGKYQGQTGLTHSKV